MLDATISDYTVGRATFSSLYEAEVALLTLERAQRSAAVETHLQQALVLALTGRTSNGETP